jgi:hypothetical protein
MDDFLTEAQEEDVTGKIAWYNQQLIVVLGISGTCMIWFYSSGTIVRIFPNGANTLRTVSRCRLVLPFSIRAIIGCRTPLNSSSFLL